MKTYNGMVLYINTPMDVHVQIRSYTGTHRCTHVYNYACIPKYRNPVSEAAKHAPVLPAMGHPLNYPPVPVLPLSPTQSLTHTLPQVMRSWFASGATGASNLFPHPTHPPIVSNHL